MIFTFFKSFHFLSLGTSGSCKGSYCCTTKGNSAGCTSCDSGGDCQTCESNYYRDSWQCESCPYGKSSSSGSTSVSSCISSCTCDDNEEISGSNTWFSCYHGNMYTCGGYCCCDAGNEYPGYGDDCYSCGCGRRLATPAITFKSITTTKVAATTKTTKLKHSVLTKLLKTKTYPDLNKMIKSTKRRRTEVESSDTCTFANDGKCQDAMKYGTTCSSLESKGFTGDAFQCCEQGTDLTDCNKEITCGGEYCSEDACIADETYKCEPIFGIAYRGSACRQEKKYPKYPLSVPKFCGKNHTAPVFVTDATGYPTSRACKLKGNTTPRPSHSLW